MPLRITVRPFAKADLDEIYDYIAMDNPSAAVRFVEGIIHHYRGLAAMPYKGKSRDDLHAGMRTLSFRGRALIAYRIDDNGIRILRIIYGGKAYPDEWES